MKNKRSFTDELTPKQVLELAACTQCGECLKHCPVQDATGDPTVSPPEKIRLFREFIRASIEASQKPARTRRKARKSEDKTIDAEKTQ